MQRLKGKANCYTALQRGEGVLNFCQNVRYVTQILVGHPKNLVTFVRQVLSDKVVKKVFSKNVFIPGKVFLREVI